jgi:hypothetical protein
MDITEGTASDLETDNNAIDSIDEIGVEDLDSPNEGDTNSPKSKEEKSELRGIWLKDKTWEKLQVVKAGLNLTWNEVMEIFCMHVLQSGLIDADNEKILLGMQDEGFQWRESYALGGPWSKSKGIIDEIASETKKINNGLEDLISVLEDHAEVILMGDTPIEDTPIEDTPIEESGDDDEEIDRTEGRRG